MNPIKYQSELEKRAEQLAVLTVDMDSAGDDENTNAGKIYIYFLFIF